MTDSEPDLFVGAVGAKKNRLFGSPVGRQTANFALFGRFGSPISRRAPGTSATTCAERNHKKPREISEIEGNFPVAKISKISGWTKYRPIRYVGYPKKGVIAG